MANVWIDILSNNVNARNMRVAVFKNSSVGYWFLTNSDGTFAYSKTTNGGQSWADPAVQIEAIGTVAADVWHDKWTPGDSGTKVHTWWLDWTNNSIKYRSLDTSSDTLGTAATVFAGASWASGRGNFVSGTKSRSGYLYAAFDIDAGVEKGLYRSTDGGANWSLLDAAFVEATIDQCLLFPASNTGDDNDIWAVYHDASTNELTLKMWDSSAGSASESAVIMSLAENTSDATGQYGFSASVRHSDGHLIVAGVSERDAAASDHMVFDVNGTGSITQKTNITTNIDDHYHPAVFIDQDTDDIYIAYNGKTDGSETLGSVPGTTAYYAKSVDGGANWTLDQAASEGGTSLRSQIWAPLMGPRFYVGWRQVDQIGGNYATSLTFGAAPASTARPVVFVCT
jgi:hypothetical protein